MQSSDHAYFVTQLGLATVASSLSPDEALVVFSELQKARRCFVLENELHLIYQVSCMVFIQWCLRMFSFAQRKTLAFNPWFHDPQQISINLQPIFCCRLFFPPLMLISINSLVPLLIKFVRVRFIAVSSFRWPAHRRHFLSSATYHS